MQTPNDKKVDSQRKYIVGVVGASESEVESLSRIFAVTNFRNRCYLPKKLQTNEYNRVHDIDFILMCSNNPRVIGAWSESQLTRQHSGRPIIFLARHKNQKLGKYQLASPVNPSRLIKLLDHYTISELNYFPEFEIGSDNNTIEDLTLSGLKILRNNALNANPDEPAKNALVVDDSLAVRRQMQIEFQLRNDNLDVVESAEDAMKAIQEKKYDIIFLDVVMPGMDGYAACKKIKKSKLNMSTPVVLLTSRSSSFDKIKGALAGCDAYLVKPINHNEFESVYEKYTDSKIARGQAHAS